MRLGPLATTRTAWPDPAPRKTIDLAISATSQPSAAAASAALRGGLREFDDLARVAGGGQRILHLLRRRTQRHGLAGELARAPGRGGDGLAHQRLQPVRRHQHRQRRRRRAVGRGHVLAQGGRRVRRLMQQLARALDGRARELHRQLVWQACLAARLRQALDQQEEHRPGRCRRQPSPNRSAARHPPSRPSRRRATSARRRRAARR